MKSSKNRLKRVFQASCGFASCFFACSGIKPEGMDEFFNTLLSHLQQFSLLSAKLGLVRRI
jgi:hypothetical protein